MNGKELFLDLAIIGGGAAGMAAAVEAYDNGINNVAIFEINNCLGGVLGQCIHAGFGLHTFGEELTGPEFSAKYEKEVYKRKIPVYLQSPVTELKEDKTMTVFSRDEGIITVHPKAVVIAQGCRERPAGAIGLDGTRPAGVLTAGTAQKYVNTDGYMVGKKVVILGSGDIGLIMARRMTLEGAKVICVCELMPYSNGLKRNIVQCLDDYGIPLRLSCTVVGLEGRGRLTGVRVAPVDPRTLKPKLDKQELIECDTLLLSVGLIPETGLAVDAGAELGSNRGLAVNSARETSIAGVFAAGNVVHVHDLADYVALEGQTAGANAAAYIKEQTRTVKEFVATSAKDGISYIVPQKILLNTENAELSFRVKNVYKKSKLVVRQNGKKILEKKRSVMLPGEMEKLTLPLNGITHGDEITLEVESSEEAE